MPEREKVIKALEWCIDKPCTPHCPYFNQQDESQAYCLFRKILPDALALLKEQEARVMTWDEMVEAGKEEKAVFVEECPKGDPVRCFWGIAFPGMELPKDVPFNYPGGVDFNVTNVDGDIWDGDFYNMNALLGWRAWTSRPTPEQMRETPWEGEEDNEA